MSSITIMHSSLFWFLLASTISGLSFAQDFSTHEINLDDAGNFTLKWAVEGDSIDIEVQVKVTGWIALGISPDGGLARADLLFAYFDITTGRINATDRMAQLSADGSQVQVMMDTVQNWEYLTGTKSDKGLTVRVRRKLETCDSMDQPITADTTRIVYSMGQELPSNILRPSIPAGIFTGKKLLLLDESLAVRRMGEPIRPATTLEWNILMDGIRIPENTDEFTQCSLQKIPTFSKRLHLIKVEPRVEQGNNEIVSSMMVYICQDFVTVSTTPKNFDCGSATSSAPVLGNCTVMLAAWANGGTTLRYPDDVGYPIGPELSDRYVLLRVRYTLDNFSTSNQRRVDSSGLKMHLSDKLRKFEAGVLPVGLADDVIVPSYFNTLRTFGLCSDPCTKEALLDDGVSVFGGLLHTGTSGKSARLRQIRDGIELPSLLKDDHLAADYQENRGIYPRRRILKGDQLLLDCSYAANVPETDALNSSSSRVETCFATVLYYPRMNMTSCQSSYLMESLGEQLGLEAQENLQPQLIVLPKSIINSTNIDLLNITTEGNITVIHPIVLQPASSLNITHVAKRDVLSVDWANRLRSFNWTPEATRITQAFYSNGTVGSKCTFENGQSETSVISRPHFIPTKPPNSTCPEPTTLLPGWVPVQTVLSLNAPQANTPRSTRSSAATMNGTSVILTLLSFGAYFVTVVWTGG
ncbi:hypothetical protein RvY_16507-1 [Ramazzottius varieornatus]|uniref:DOMON domain-containing protein n=1 Tax=Ramazzottius varieornatus TaxID=947166 RepID=A0A1D1W313_RAMVA|nr:hypothetical protein RvY_16507-1 [Ramazzottius varieornatus]